jgi:hypothetical protein
MNYKGFIISDKEVEETVDKLGCSMLDACDMILSDKGLISNDEIEEMSKKARENKITTVIHDAKSGKNKRKAPKRKENLLKQEIIDAVLTGLLDFHPDNRAFSVRNKEKYIDFTIAGRDFTVNLVEHRPKKK